MSSNLQERGAVVNTGIILLITPYFVTAMEYQLMLCISLMHFHIAMQPDTLLRRELLPAA